MSHEILRTERLRLRAYTTTDEAEVFADPYARRFYPEMADRANVRAWIEWNLRNYDELGFGLGNGAQDGIQLIGDCALMFQDVDAGESLRSATT